jgi:hypothetical protein
MVGALESEIAYVHARRGRHGEAWAHWERADAIARRLGPTYRHVQTSFSQPVIGAHATTLGVELRRPGEALRAADSFDPDTIPSLARRSRHLIEVARGHYQRGERAAAWAMLNRSERTASETIKYNGYAREMLLGLRNRPPTGLRRRGPVPAGWTGQLTRSARGTTCTPPTCPAVASCAGACPECDPFDTGSAYGVPVAVRDPCSAARSPSTATGRDVGAAACAATVGWASRPLRAPPARSDRASFPGHGGEGVVTRSVGDVSNRGSRCTARAGAMGATVAPAFESLPGSQRPRAATCRMPRGGRDEGPSSARFGTVGSATRDGASTAATRWL